MTKHGLTIKKNVIYYNVIFNKKNMSIIENFILIVSGYHLTN